MAILEQMETKIIFLEHKIARLNAVNDINDVMGRYETLYNPLTMH